MSTPAAVALEGEEEELLLSEWLWTADMRLTGDHVRRLLPSRSRRLTSADAVDLRAAWREEAARASVAASRSLLEPWSVSRL